MSEGKESAEDPLEAFDEDVEVEGEEVEEDPAASVLQHQRGRVVVGRVLPYLSHLYLLADRQGFLVQRLQHHEFTRQLRLVLPAPALLTLALPLAPDVHHLVHDELLLTLVLLQQRCHLQHHLPAALSVFACWLAVGREGVGVEFTQRGVSEFAALLIGGWLVAAVL